MRLPVGYSAAGSAGSTPGAARVRPTKEFDGETIASGPPAARFNSGNAATGNAVLYGADGKAIARNPGQTRLELLLDDGGTPTDPSDDEILDQRVVRESTGRNDDFCAAVVPALG